MAGLIFCSFGVCSTVFKEDIEFNFQTDGLDGFHEFGSMVLTGLDGRFSSGQDQWFLTRTDRWF